MDSSDASALQSAICGVWASLYSRRAVLSRHAAGVAQEDACMAVLVQQQLAPDVCFVLHTAHPLTRDPATLCAELAPGMGETLAAGARQVFWWFSLLLESPTFEVHPASSCAFAASAGTRGSPWRLEVTKSSGAVTTSAFANFSQAFLPVAGTRTSPASAAAGGGTVAPAAVAAVRLQPVDYSQQMLSGEALPRRVASSNGGACRLGPSLTHVAPAAALVCSV